ncbi:translation initiation factor IF-2-like [Gallus gallus]|uniref:translation initiation factor IF-2-like n=1 Tax=Gallus gallus TaxID=9031 RepID=UPI001F000D0C|nr:translation initiation factor IF-2-like [Gallus gallus]XP_046799889.1 translation initiation factor IF-2-like [Gallus gallus]
MAKAAPERGAPAPWAALTSRPAELCRCPGAAARAGRRPLPDAPGSLAQPREGAGARAGARSAAAPGEAAPCARLVRLRRPRVTSATRLRSTTIKVVANTPGKGKSRSSRSGPGRPRPAGVRRREPRLQGCLHTPLRAVVLCLREKFAPCAPPARGNGAWPQRSRSRDGSRPGGTAAACGRRFTAVRIENCKPAMRSLPMSSCEVQLLVKTSSDYFRKQKH